MEELLATYALSDGKIRSLQLGLEYTSASNSPLRQASIALQVRKKTANGKLKPCLLQLKLIGIRKLVFNEEFDSCYYSDVIFKKLENGLWYLSLDPSGNSGEPDEEDNMVVVAESVEVEEGAQDKFLSIHDLDNS
ncbi:hypothetical protein GCM10011375_06780 [Hymenobacter qilianensis]|uniref:Uncharacterized protein n=2 Tax=Hymenobacter qilianensis TaxID=1385715 RepID=A0ACB5PMR2_9BACT|nr:hypothetical protein [Hymenobacter qilianensis]QNP53675.1 hypothetical protein H9L05_09090 [Hymenobacter qilianensis]GGF53964.1 hypothetical protein GCM10011375_06780 [Hymenobacter qilianensis]